MFVVAEQEQSPGSLSRNAQCSVPSAPAMTARKNVLSIGIGPVPSVAACS